MERQAEIERLFAMRVLRDMMRGHVKSLRACGLNGGDVREVMIEMRRGEWKGKEVIKKALVVRCPTIITESMTETIAAPLASAISATGYRIREMRAQRRPMTMPSLRDITDGYCAAAMRAVAKVVPKMNSKNTPSIRCVPSRSAAVIDTSDGGSVSLSPNWGRSVYSQDIAVCEWLNDHVLVVQARPKSSAFLADMGVRCFSVMGMRIGQKAYRVDGYAFQTNLGGESVAIFHEDFRRGVAQVEKRIIEAAEKVFAAE